MYLLFNPTFTMDASIHLDDDGNESIKNGKVGIVVIFHLIV